MRQKRDLIIKEKMQLYGLLYSGKYTYEIAKNIDKDRCAISRGSQRSRLHWKEVT